MSAGTASPGGPVAGRARPSLIDAHCHSVLVADLSDAEFTRRCTESSEPAPAGTSYLDSPLGLAVRRWCAPVLGLDALAPAAAYLAQRRRLGGRETSRLLLSDCGLDAVLVDTGFRDGEAGVTGIAALGNTCGYEVVRLETLAERIAPTVAPRHFAGALRQALVDLGPDVVALKSIVAYRYGFDIDPARPTDAEVATAAADWYRSWPRQAVTPLRNPVLLRFLLWEALTAGGPVVRPLQLHAGYGDADLDLHRSNPVLLTGLIRAVQAAGGAPIVLLHCYPYHREAAYLAAVYPGVFFDLGLAVAHVGPAAPALISQALELAPFGKLQYSSDGSGLAELFHVGARSFVRALDRVLSGWVEDGDAGEDDVAAIRAGVLAGNARRLYPALAAPRDPGAAANLTRGP